MSDERLITIQEAIASCRRLLRDHPRAERFRLTIERRHVKLWLEHLESLDPDMPPPPICKALGPLVGDMMMNDKLHRLDAIADKLGTLVILLQDRGGVDG